MINVLLTKIKTKDGITLDGIYVKPRRKGKIPRHSVPGSQRQHRLGTALIWVHGLTSRFYSGQTLIQELSQKCSQNKIGYFKFNTRGHDIVVRGNKYFIGSAFEKFEDCVKDIRAMIKEAKRLGYSDIFLAGHSTGANKVLYYLYKTQDRSIKGLILVGSLSDIVVNYKLFGKKEIKRRLAVAEHLKNKKSDHILPQEYGIWSASRFISLLTPGKPEDTFPYHNPKANWKELKSIHVPLAVILGSRDEHLNMPAKKLVEIFRANAKRTKSLSGIIIKGARHSFQKKEKELTKVIVNWTKQIK